MRKLLFLTSVKGMWPFVQDLSYHLKKQKYDIDFLDYEEHRLISYNTNKTKLKVNPPKYRKIYRWKLYPLWKKVVALKYRTFLKKIEKSYDVTLILFLDSKLNRVADEIKNTSNKLVIYIAGSDFYAQDDFNKHFNEKLLDKADIINFTNPYMRNDFIEYYKKYQRKSTVYSLGLSNLDNINNIKKHETIAETKQKLNVISNKIIVTVGYSGDRRHQHLKTFNYLKNINDEIKKNLFFIIPMTYGADLEYINEIKKYLDKNKLNYKIISDVLSDENVSRLRVVTDVFINVRTTDQLSGSMLEHLHAGSVVFAGEWLPYQKLEDINIYYYKVNFENLKKTFCRIIKNIEQHKINCKKNNDKIYFEFSWKNRIQDLIKIL